MKEKIKAVLAEIEDVTSHVQEGQLERAADHLTSAERIFVFGEGRSGFMAKSFAMRLMHLGVQSFVIGETTTPSIQKGDVIVLVSGSGKTKSVCWTAERAAQLGCVTIAVTTDPASPLASHASSILHVPAATKYRNEGERKSIQPLGSLFDQSTHVLFDVLCLNYAEKQDRTHEQTFKLHSNVE
ncbi:6-phospho-3-hexuloisomerase [Domibacillus sp. DTU_2020_1001157_1_SI_ALB_TIR_016]|uniref:6-phospho-3-hexuloisomerase n=1 Tax=Domibacillus sp. DTU_2020_1001157_1_SI_ALB_TIR_016 TaxID=3077789 RepID=UPI0028ECC009|nr:6-phospho-3-hexuloisomerase [Domibacillus sp. DTU_2020_1001157_1_SI_ALB_TIR_016]WNS81428.1 6-phospho-3-hexuloisomerase [Domibacillus sp. DTU_2020_1001157_1_SI_ALB_TIR_016]